MQTQEYVREPEKRVPVARSVDVVVAGAGCAGVFAALAAARAGAKCLLVEYFGSLGGNIGPGMIYGCVDPMAETSHLAGGNTGIVREFAERLMKLKEGLPETRPVYASLCSDLAMRMAREAGVELMLSAYVADPLLENGRVAGVFVETKSGRAAIRAKAVIDDTAQAELAMRAGAPMIRHVKGDPDFSPVIRARYRQAQYENWNEVGLIFLVAGIDWERYGEFIKDSTPAMLKTVEGFPPFELKGMITSDDPAVTANLKYPSKLLSAMRQEWESGRYRFARVFRPQAGLIWLSNMSRPEKGFVQIGKDGGEGATIIQGDIDIDDWSQVSRAESELRLHAFDTVEFMRRNAPGFESAYVIFTAPFAGARGGPFIDGEYLVTPQDIIGGARHEDVVLRATWETVNLKINENRKATPLTKEGYDLPYRMMLPKGLDGLLVVGRGSSYIRRGHDPATRGRVLQFHLGQVAGTAAALAAQSGVSVRSLDVRMLQRELLKQGFFFGDAQRLREIGLR